MKVLLFLLLPLFTQSQVFFKATKATVNFPPSNEIHSSEVSVYIGFYMENKSVRKVTISNSFKDVFYITNEKRLIENDEVRWSAIDKNSKYCTISFKVYRDYGTIIILYDNIIYGYSFLKEPL